MWKLVAGGRLASVTGPGGGARGSGRTLLTGVVGEFGGVEGGAAGDLDVFVFALVLVLAFVPG